MNKDGKGGHMQTKTTKKRNHDYSRGASQVPHGRLTPVSKEPRDFLLMSTCTKKSRIK